MAEFVAATGNLSLLPTEVLLNIFKYLPLKDQARSQRVCKRFKVILTDTLNDDDLWYENCKKDFDNVYQIAKRKARVELWADLYKSLALWSKLSRATEVIQECAPASNDREIVLNVEAITQGIIGIHKRRFVEYYDVDTLQQIQGSIRGYYIDYTENEDTVIITDFYMNLIVLRKVLNCSYYKTYVIDNVKSFVLSGRLLFYATTDNEIFICNLDEEDPLQFTYLRQIEESVMCIGYKNGVVHILTFSRNIYSIINNELILSYHVHRDDNIVHVMHHFNLLAVLDLRLSYQWKCMASDMFPGAPSILNAVSIYVYGDVVFVGYFSGMLNVYYKPFVNGNLEFRDATPVKQYFFKDTEEEECPILKVDVIEVKNGHWVVVAMPKKIGIIKLVH